jgi:hypothetical protein
MWGHQPTVKSRVHGYQCECGKYLDNKEAFVVASRTFGGLQLLSAHAKKSVIQERCHQTFQSFVCMPVARLRQAKK